LHGLGRTSDATALFERLLSLRNDVGLLSEEYDPKSGRHLGNTPQAFSHAGVVATAVLLSGENRPALEDQLADAERAA
jgi:GH15 family glucan-1,4-alpha-glucosidase